MEQYVVLTSEKDIGNRLQILKNDLKNYKKGELAVDQFGSFFSLVNRALILRRYSNHKPIYQQCEEVLKEIFRTYQWGEGRRELRLKVDRNIECGVCLDENKFINTFKFNCGHEFCKPCVRKVLLSSKLCPLCRGLITVIEGDHCYRIDYKARRIVVGDIDDS